MGGGKGLLNLWTLISPAICLFLLAFVVRIAFVVTLENRLYWPDEIAFDDIALGLLNGEGYQSEPYRANPVLPFFLAAVYRLFGYSYFTPRLVQSLIGSLTVFIVFAIAQLLFCNRVAFLAGLWAALYPPLIYICGVFYVSCIFTFLIALSVYLLSLCCKSKCCLSFALLPLCGLVMGITILCRPIFLAFLPFAIFLIVSSYRGRAVRRIAYAIALVMIASLTILPWTLRNYALYKRVIPVSTGSGLLLWKGNNELARGDTDDRYLEPGTGETWTGRLKELEPSRRSELAQKYNDVWHDLQALDQIDYDKYLQNLALAFMGQHPGRALELFVRKLITLYTPFTEVRPQHIAIINSTERIAFSVIFYPTLLIGLLGALYALREWRRYLVLYLPIISLTFAYALLTAASRFRIEFEPYIIIFASYAIITIWDFTSTHRYRARF